MKAFPTYFLSPTDLCSLGRERELKENLSLQPGKEEASE